MKCLSSTTSVRAELLCHAKAVLRRVWIHFSTQVKTIKEKERYRLLVGLVQPGRALSWPQKAALNVCFQQPGRCCLVALYKGTFSQVLLQKFVFPLHAMYDVCVLSSSPLQDKALLFSCCWSAAHQKGKGALPFFCGTSVCADCVLYLFVACVRCCLQKKDRCKSAEEKTAASEKFCRAW